jgi:hypothetical protein
LGGGRPVFVCLGVDKRVLKRPERQHNEYIEEKNTTQEKEAPNRGETN